MFKAVPLAAAFMLFLGVAAFAQDDSLHYDLGRVLVKKSATQTISISGTDLEKYQASDLSDAINVWLYGTYTKSAAIIYVIDGNIISDVNAYSIYDIEEVTLIQSVTAQSSGASPGQQMVLIKTRTNRSGKKGIEVNGQNSLVNLRNATNTPGVTSNNSVYDQYYLSAYRNYSNAKMGLTAEYQRDVDPGLNGDGLEFLEPSHYDRLKLNAYFNANLGKHNVLILGANYVPQVTDLSSTRDTLSTSYTPPEPENILYKTHVSQHMMNLNLNFKSDIARGLTNRFSAAYNHYNYFERDSSRDNVDTNNYVTGARASESSHNMLVRDYLYYHTRLDSMDFESTLNMTYRNFEDVVSYDDIQGYFAANTPYYSYIHNSSSITSYKNLMLSPSAGLYYKEAINMQAGFVSLLDNGKAAGSTSTPGHVFPFFNASFSPLKLIGITAIRWQLYASYARQSPLIADEYSTLAAYDLLPSPATIHYFNNGTYNSFQEYNNYQAGTAVGITKNFSISYSYEYKYAQSFYQIRFFSVANDGLVYGQAPYNSKTVTNHFALHYNIHKPNFTWNTSLNGTESAIQVVDNPAVAAANNAAYLGAGHRWSGGYTNRFTFKIFFAGVDFLYQAGSRPDDLINALPGSPTYIRLPITVHLRYKTRILVHGSGYLI